jgi:hypothetical protein
MIAVYNRFRPTTHKAKTANDANVFVPFAQSHASPHSHQALSAANIAAMHLCDQLSARKLPLS